MFFDKCERYDDLFECLVRRLAHFETDCAMMQRIVGGRIITGPIRYVGWLDNLTVAAYPDYEDIIFTNASGTELPSVNPGDTFYVSVPATDDTYLVDVVVYLNLCDETGGDIGIASDLFAQLLFGATNARVNIDLPDCYVVFDSLRFFVNPAPTSSVCGCGGGCSCGRHGSGGCGCGGRGSSGCNNYVMKNGIRFNCGCINVPNGSVAGDTSDGSFTVPCCSRFDGGCGCGR